MYNIEDYSPNGIPNLYGHSNKKSKVIIDPNIEYFQNVIKKDRDVFEKLILINGCEPLVVNQMGNLIKEHHNYFDKIYSYDKEVLNHCHNSELFIFGSSWVITDQNNNLISHKKDYHNNFKIENKKFKLSFVKSTKNYLLGHRFRHQISHNLKKQYPFEIFFPESIKPKLKLFEDSMFHLCVENCQQENYFTEKIIDCFMSYTIPIYWGSPNIGDYFDLNGIIIINSEIELIDILNNLKEDDYYNKLESIKKNYQICVDNNYAFFFDRVNELINKI